MYRTEKKKDECLLDGVAIELQCAPYVLISRESCPFFPFWSDDVENTNTPMKCNQTEVGMNVMSVRKKRLQSNIINMLTMYVHAY